MQIDPTAVSYTHLDVYKRQVHAGGGDADEQAPIEARIARLHGKIGGIGVQDHAAIIGGRPGADWPFSDLCLGTDAPFTPRRR